MQKCKWNIGKIIIIVFSTTQDTDPSDALRLKSCVHPPAEQYNISFTTGPPWRSQQSPTVDALLPRDAKLALFMLS